MQHYHLYLITLGKTELLYNLSMLSELCINQALIRPCPFLHTVGYNQSRPSRVAFHPRTRIFYRGISRLLPIERTCHQWVGHHKVCNGGCCTTEYILHVVPNRSLTFPTWFHTIPTADPILRSKNVESLYNSLKIYRIT